MSPGDSDGGGEGCAEFSSPCEDVAFLDSIRSEVMRAVGDVAAPYIKKTGAKMTCRLCPSRLFSRKAQLRRHLGTAHDVESGSGASPSRVFQLAKAIFNRDQIQIATWHLVGKVDAGGTYL